MCGIAGVFARTESALGPSRELLSQMCAELDHRGPDERGLYRDPRVGLVHTRLSIIDLAGGQQPMSNEDESLWLVFNGEIFNYLELREELLSHGHCFRTKSDTEVIVHAYEQWGTDAFERFNGQWAVALYDRRKKELVLCRDRYGVRPLYYAEHGGRVYFGSEIAALLAAPELPREIDPVGLVETFTFWSPIAPQTAFEAVRELEPGHARVYRDGQVHDTVHFAPSYEKTSRIRSIEEAVEAVTAALTRAVSLRMLRADVPVGSYLSGGLDSSLVVALGKKAKGGSFATFSLRFEDAALDETRYQRSVARHVDTEHHEIVVTRRDIAELFPQVVRHAERPILRTAPAPLFMLSRLVRAHGIKVVLTGEGADEMFAGYDIFREAKVRRFWARDPESKLRPRLLERLYPYLQRSPTSARVMARRFFARELGQAHRPGFSHGTRWSSTAALSRLLSAGVRSAAAQRGDPVRRLLESLPTAFSSWSPLGQDQYLECHTLLSPYLLSAQGDRMLMANSVEGRFPFLDKDLIALANSLPDAFKLRVLDEKHVLKRVGRGMVPREVLARPKQPYRAPDASSFVGPDAPEWVSEVTTPRALSAHGLFEPEAVRQLLTKCRAQSADSALSNTDNMALVGVLSTQLLVRELVERPAVRAPVGPIRTFVEQD